MRYYQSKAEAIDAEVIEPIKGALSITAAQVRARYDVDAIARHVLHHKDGYSVKAGTYHKAREGWTVTGVSWGNFWKIAHRHDRGAVRRIQPGRLHKAR